MAAAVSRFQVQVYLKYDRKETAVCHRLHGSSIWFESYAESYQTRKNLPGFSNNVKSNACKD